MADVRYLKKAGSYLCRYRDRTGKRVGKSFNVAKMMAEHNLVNKNAVRIWVEDWGLKTEVNEANIAAGNIAAPEFAKTLKFAFDEWIVYLETKCFGEHELKFRESTISDHGSYFRNHIAIETPNWGGEEMLLSEINASKFANLIHYLETHGRSLRTVGRVRATLSLLLSFAIRFPEWGLKNNPAIEVKTESKPTGGHEHSKKKIVIPSRDEVKKILTLAREIRDREISEKNTVKNVGKVRGVPGWIFPYIAIGVFTGMRGGEIRGLKWENIEGLNGECKPLIKVVIGADRYGKLAGLKTNAANREISIPSGLADILNEYKKECGNGNELGLLFGSSIEGSNPTMGPTGPRKRILNILKELKIGTFDEDGKFKAKFSGHAFRHYCVSDWISRGLKGIALTAPVGHEKESFTRETYWHLFDEDLKKSAEVTADNDAASDMLAA